MPVYKKSGVFYFLKWRIIISNAFSKTIFLRAFLPFYLDISDWRDLFNFFKIDCLLF